MSLSLIKYSDNFTSAEDYLLRINNSVDYSIRNINSLFPGVNFKSITEIQDSNTRLLIKDFSGTVTLYKYLNQTHYYKELLSISNDPNLLIALKIKFLNFLTDEQRNIFKLIIEEQINKIIQLREIIDKWIYYTEDINESYTGDIWGIFDIVEQVNFTRLLAYILQKRLYELFSNSSFENNINAETSSNEQYNAFNNTSIAEVEKWFMQLATRTNKQGLLILTEEHATQFINQVFVKNVSMPNKLVANYGMSGYWNFVRLFCEYYEHCIYSNGNRALDERPNIRDKYIKLLTENFVGFDFEKIKKNFNKKVGLTWIPKK